jgi:hypothetical protein
MSVYVVFFGGWKASKIEMELWLASAKNVCGADVEYDAFPYPDGAGYRDTNAVDGFSKQFDGAIKKIKDSGAATTYIVGHSSGCAIANELNSRLKGDHSHITLVDLDGFAPSPDQINQRTTGRRDQAPRRAVSARTRVGAFSCEDSHHPRGERF